MAERSADALVESVRGGGLMEAGTPGPVLLLCSAGRDSHCLLDIAVRVLGAAAVRVLHVDHGLREGAAGDAAQLTARCDALGVSVRVARAEPRTPGGNLQAWAREQRRSLAAAEHARTGAARVMTAHTRTDLVETALGRLATQPGRRALLSMRDQEELPGGGHLVRPLLSFTREETGRYCRARGITWREDPSNADRTYARARLRHGVVPVLRSLNPGAEANIARTLSELAEEGAALDAIVAAELPPGAAELQLERLAALPAALGRLVLRELAERSLARPCPRAGSRLADLLALAPAAERAGTASVDVGEGARLELRGGLVRCVASRGSAAAGRPRP